MVAVRNILLVVAAGSTLVNAACWNVSIKVRRLNNVSGRGESPLFILTLAKSSDKYL